MTSAKTTSAKTTSTKTTSTKTASTKTTSTKITLSVPTTIPFDKLELSQSNVRRIHQGQSIEDLAEDIAHRGLLQSLCVRPLLDADGQETGRYEVPAGGRRFRSLELLVKSRRMSKTMRVPCIVREADGEMGAREDSLAENAMREALHPLDQFRAFKALSDAGMSEADIAARFFVSATIVKQRLRLAAVSPILLDAYAAGELTLECLMAFTVTEDAERQVQLWEKLTKQPGGYGFNAWTIKSALTDRAVRSDTPRAAFVGEEAYVAAGGTVLRDLFDMRGEGWFQDTALLDRLAEEKLAEAAQPVLAEGWKWIEVSLSFAHGNTQAFRVLPTCSDLDESEAAKLEEAIGEYDELNAQFEYGEEKPDETVARLTELDEIITALEARTRIHDPADIAIGGAFVTLAYDGSLDIRRGYVRPQDEPRPESEAGEGGGSDGTGQDDTSGPSASGENATPVENSERRVAIIPIGGNSAASAVATPEPEETERPITEQHKIELTTYRTIALREALAGDPEAAFLAVLHAMVIRVVVNEYRVSSCLEVTTRCTCPDHNVQGLEAFAPAIALDARREAWAKRLPSDHNAIWSFLRGLEPQARADLFALCAGLSVNAMHDLYNRRPDCFAPADDLAELVGLDMTQSWSPTAVNYFGRVTKTRILNAVREAKGEDTVRLLESLKKADMAREAERLLAGSGWLPELLRTSGLDRDPGTEPEQAGSVESANPQEQATEELPAFLTNGDDEPEPAGRDENDDDTSYPVAAE